MGRVCVVQGTSVAEVHTYGIPLEKLVVGKYVESGSVSFTTPPPFVN